MDSAYLQRWKAQIVKHQQHIRSNQPVAQGTLFELVGLATDPEAIDPFALTVHSFSFFRLPANGSGEACILCLAQRLQQLHHGIFTVVHIFHNIISQILATRSLW